MIGSTTHIPATAERGGQLEDTVGAIREALAGDRDWAATATRVAAAVREQMPTASILSRGQRTGSPERTGAVRLHVEPDGTFSVVAFVCREQQATQVHDHVTWCVFAVLAGEPVEELFTLDETESALVPAGRQACPAGTVSGGAPPGDIHRVANPDAETAISLHVYGTDVSRLGSSVRRIYDLPIRPNQDPTTSQPRSST